MRESKRTIIRMVRNGVTLENARRLYEQGVISVRVWELYCSLWRNGAARFSSELEAYERSQWRGLARQAIAVAYNMKGE